MSVNERREIELKNKDKTVHKMSRDGLVEQNVSQGTAQNVSRRERDADFSRPAADERPTAPNSTARSHKPHAQAPGNTTQPPADPAVAQSAGAQTQQAGPGQQPQQADPGQPFQEHRAATYSGQNDPTHFQRPKFHRDKASRGRVKYDLSDDGQQAQPEGGTQQGAAPGDSGRVSDHSGASEKFTEKRTTGQGTSGTSRGADEPPPGQKRKSKLNVEPDGDAPPDMDGGDGPGPGDGGGEKYTRQKKLDHAEKKSHKANAKAYDARQKVPTKKKLKTRLEFDEKKGKQKRKFYFEDQVKTKPGLVERGAAGAGRTVNRQAHKKMYQVERENVGTESAHRTEQAAESVGRGVSRLRGNKIQRTQRKARKMEKKAVKARANLSYERALKKNPELAKEGAVKKALHKRKIKKDYIKKAKKKAKQAEKAARAGTRAVARIAGAIARHPVATAVIIIVLVLVILLMSLFGVLGTGLGQSALTVLGGTYVAEDAEINQAELYYTEMETDLYQRAYALEGENPGYDEYRYNIGEISHNPYELMAYLSAVYDDFTFEQVKAELESIFAAQYNLWTEVEIEIRTREVERTDPDTGETYTETEEYEYRIFNINLSASLMSSILYSRMDSDQQNHYGAFMYTRGTRFYFSPPFDDLDWTAHVSDGWGYRIHPVNGGKDNHKAVDIAVPGGTPIVAAQHGTVTFAGWDDSYGNYVIIEDAEEGLKSLYAHCDSLAVSSGQSITRGDVIGYVGSTGTSTGNHLHLEVYRDGVCLNPLYFVDPGSGGEFTGGGMAGYPGEAYDDETYQRLMAEATKYIGWPYVWGGSSPSTSFDCSGFVSWVYTASGVYNIGRDTAQGIYNRCAPVSAADARPGDLVFFHSTYSTTSYVTHIGIYVGNGQMLHCGNPIGYASLSSSYWQQHFIGYGRLV